MSIGSGFDIAMSGMKVAQSQLDLVSQNIANVDTPGYTKKSVTSESLVLAGQNSGVYLGTTTREVSEGLLKSYLTSSSLSGALSSKSEYLERTEMLLGTAESNNSITTNVSDLQTAFDTLAIDVTSSAGRSNLINQATSLTNRLNSLSQDIQTLRGDADLEIYENVEIINSTLQSIAELNDEIVKYSLLGYEGAANMMDQRDEALKELSSLIDVSYFTRENGEIVIQTTTGITLLDGHAHELSHSPISQISPSASYASGAVDGIYVDGVDITNSIKDGELAGLIEIRDVILPSLQSQLDELAGVITSELNAAHNRGTSFPAGSYELTGTRTFIDSANQTIGFSDGDVRITIFDAAGKQVDTTTLVADIGFNNGSIDDMAAAIQNWMNNDVGLPQAEVMVDADGKLQVKTGDSEYFISFSDVATAIPGAEQQDVSISFGIGGGTSRDFEGFSSFFGLNDMFVTPSNNESIYDSQVLNKNAPLGVTATSPVVLNFYDASGNVGSVTIFANDTLQTVTDKINELDNNLIASLVPNGTGYVFRIEDTTGQQIEITDGGSGFLTRLGMEPSDVTLSGSLEVNPMLVENSNKIAVGIPAFNPNTGTYEMTSGENSVANAMAKVFSDTQEFGQAGSIASTKTTLANYSSTFVGEIASQTSNAQSELDYQISLSDSIAFKQAQESGVDIDEELANMIVYQQTYSACAQAFSATREMLDTLFSMMN